MLTGGAGNELYLGGAGSDTMTLGTGADIIGFNRGDGQDIVNASTGADNTLSLGGGIKYADVALRKAGNDLVVDVGATEQLTLRDWYLATSNRHVVNLQMVVDASAAERRFAERAVQKASAQFRFPGCLRSSMPRALRTGETHGGWTGRLPAALGGSETARPLGREMATSPRHATRGRIGWTGGQFASIGRVRLALQCAIDGDVVPAGETMA